MRAIKFFALNRRAGCRAAAVPVRPATPPEKFATKHFKETFFPRRAHKLYAKTRKKNIPVRCLYGDKQIVVPLIGVEPIWYHYQWILSPSRLPIPPQRQASKLYNTFRKNASVFKA